MLRQLDALDKNTFGSTINKVPAVPNTTNSIPPRPPNQAFAQLTNKNMSGIQLRAQHSQNNRMIDIIEGGH
jgi:hypothetical protein